MNWEYRLIHSRTLVIGASYSPSDISTWSKIDPCYIGLGFCYDELQTLYRQNPLGFNWKKDPTPPILHELKHYFDIVIIDHGTWHHLCTFNNNVSNNTTTTNNINRTNNTTNSNGSPSSTFTNGSNNQSYNFPFSVGESSPSSTNGSNESPSSSSTNSNGSPSSTNGSSDNLYNLVTKDMMTPNGILVISSQTVISESKPSNHHQSRLNHLLTTYFLEMDVIYTRNRESYHVFRKHSATQPHISCHHLQELKMKWT